MSDELNALQETALQARAKADELSAALTDASSDEEREAAKGAEQAALTAESAYADAKAKADAEAAAQGGGSAEKVGDTCTLPDGTEGVLVEQDGALVCVSKEKLAADAEASRTGFADKGLHAGDACVCPDGRNGTVHSFDAGLICIPNADQG
jgi:hypothetical protein